MDGIFAAVRQVMANGALRRVAAGGLASVASEWTFVVALLVTAHDFGGVVGVAAVTTARMLPAALLGAGDRGHCRPPAPRAGPARRPPRPRHVGGGGRRWQRSSGWPALVVAAAVVEGMAAVLKPAHDPVAAAAAGTYAPRA